MKISFKQWRNRGGSRAAAISKMERFVIIVNGFQLLTIITKRSILHVAAALDPLLNITFKVGELEAEISDCFALNWTGNSILAIKYFSQNYTIYRIIQIMYTNEHLF